MDFYLFHIETIRNTLCEFLTFAGGGKWECAHSRLPCAFAKKIKKVLDFWKDPCYYTTCVRDDAGVVQW